MRRSLISCFTLLVSLVFIFPSYIHSQEQNPDISQRINAIIEEMDAAVTLTDEQKSKIKTILVNYFENAPQTSEQRPQSREARMQMYRAGRELLTKREEAIEAVLTPEQLQKYHAMQQKQRIDTRIARLDEALNLSDEQKDQIRLILEEEVENTEEIRAQETASRQERFTSMRDRREKTNKAIEEVLTKEQVEKFRTMRENQRGRMRRRPE